MTFGQRMRYQQERVKYKLKILQCNLHRNVLRRFDHENVRYQKYYLFGKVSSRITMAACTMQMGVAIYPASNGRKKMGWEKKWIKQEADITLKKKY